MVGWWIKLHRQTKPYYTHWMFLTMSKLCSIDKSVINAGTTCLTGNPPNVSSLPMTNSWHISMTACSCWLSSSVACKPVSSCCALVPIENKTIKWMIKVHRVIYTVITQCTKYATNFSKQLPVSHTTRFNFTVTINTGLLNWTFWWQMVSIKTNTASDIYTINSWLRLWPIFFCCWQNDLNITN